MSDQEKDMRTLEAMGRMYCKKFHQDAAKDEAGLCTECRQTVNATAQRTQACPFNHEGNCQDCPIKCQRGDAQDRIKAIMKYSAPRMLFAHPAMTLRYLQRKIHGKKAAK